VLAIIFEVAFFIQTNIDHIKSRRWNKDNKNNCSKLYQWKSRNREGL